MFMLAMLCEVLPVVAALSVVAVLAVPLWREKLPRPVRLDGSSRPDAAARWTLASGAALLVLFAVTVTVMRFHRIRLGGQDYSWWRYSIPLLAACLVLLVVAVLLVSYRRQPAEPVAPTHPRTWRSFTGTSQLWLFGSCAFALILFVAFAGSASSPDDEGRYRWLVIDTGATGGMVADFFGWAYGLPAAAAALVLLVLTVLVLHLNAVRPFFTPNSVGAEEASRSAFSYMVVCFGAGAVLLTLARALNTASSAAGVSLASEGYSFDTTLAAASPWLLGLSYLVQFFALFLLMTVVAVAVRRPQPQAATVHG
ncbi:hypothetical protein FEF26_08465 [Nesterenkonia salmonea]|uniref:Uncharacterized protein n=1 Tax=Nesterenkonia salmonea TaxID=1804987 RepID=A0A5R9BBT2_9MICC|nr:hypothetical protein [Nesterenkonia salmonea]TLP97003.1 hypothetical protein FEF26_08465 [Nesterenkonia salmonea]